MSQSRMLQIKTSEGAMIANRCIHAQDALSRLVGLLNHKELKSGEAMLIEPCSQVHMFFMRFSIDVLFLSRDKEVVGIEENLKPWRWSSIYWKAKKALELPSGTRKTLNLMQGQRLEIEPCIS